jgi:glucosamine-6-phosphate deaminase
VKTLSEETRIDNARFFGSLDQVPLHCVTQGVGIIMAAGELLLIATGPSKAAPIKAALEGPITTMCPASAIQLHLQATVILDEAAATSLTLADYHRLTHTQRPRVAADVTNCSSGMES